MGVRIELIRDPGGLLIFTTGRMTRSLVRERLAELDLEYTEAPKWFGWRTEFFVTIPHGRDSGNIRAWLKDHGAR